MKKKCIVLLDGSNFYFKLKDLGFHNLLNFDFQGFVKYLSRSNKLESSTYYIGRVRQDGSKKSEKMLSDQQKLLSVLKRSKIKYSLGYLLKSGKNYHEKGVDVQIAVDMLVATYENTCDRVILVSSDTDLAPAIKQAQKKQRIIEYVGFSHKPSVAMVRFCAESRLLTKEDLLPFVRTSK